MVKIIKCHLNSPNHHLTKIGCRVHIYLVTSVPKGGGGREPQVSTVTIPMSCAAHLPPAPGLGLRIPSSPVLPCRWGERRVVHLRKPAGRVWALAPSATGSHRTAFWHPLPQLRYQFLQLPEIWAFKSASVLLSSLPVYTFLSCLK